MRGHTPSAKRPSRAGRLTMRRRAADNDYLHKDFHGALNQALIYLEERFGGGAVKEYLEELAGTCFAPLTEGIRARGLEALRDHFVSICGREGAAFTMTFSPDELVLTIPACPAVTRISEMGLDLSPSFIETARTLHAAVCRGTGIDYELLRYEPATGGSVERFSRRRV